MQEPLTIFNGYQPSTFKHGKDVHYHVGIVYRLLTELITFYALGVYIGGVFPLLSYLSFVGSFVCLYYVLSAQQEPTLYWSHVALSTTLGINVGHIVRTLYIIDQSIVNSAISMTLLTFLTFTYVSNFVTSSHMVPVYGFLCSLLNGLVLITLFRLFFGGSYNIMENMIALLTFSGFVTYDTFLMYDKLTRGDYNYYKHAINLFLDIVNLFVRFLEFFANKKTNQKKKN